MSLCLSILSTFSSLSLRPRSPALSCAYPLTMSQRQSSKSLPPPTTQSSARPSFNRAKSLKLNTSSQPTIPIPPSLLAKAPHLASNPNSMPSPSRDPRIPSRADEAWLGDTVPLSKSDGKQNHSGARMTVVRRADGGANTPGGERDEHNIYLRTLISN